MCCFSCSCAFKLQLVPVLALGLVRALGYEQHLLLLLLLFLLRAADAIMDVLAPPILDAVSAILCAACLVTARLNFNWCRFLLWVWFGL